MPSWRARGLSTPSRKGELASRKQEADQVRREELLGRLRELIAELRYLNVSDGEILALMKEGVGQ